MALRLLLVVLSIGLVGWAGASGLTTRFDAASLQAAVDRAGALGPVVFVLAFTAAELLHVPAVLFVVTAAVIWPLPIALATAYCGALVAALVVVFLARFALADLVRTHLVHRLPERLRGIDERLAAGGLREVIVLRLVTFMLPAAHWVLGASRARARDIVLGTALGILPGIVLGVVLGQSVFHEWDRWRPYVFAAGGVFLTWRLVVHWRRRRRADA